MEQKSVRDTGTSPDNLCRLAGIMLTRHGEAIRNSTIKGYVGIKDTVFRYHLWKSIRDKGYEWEKLTVDERREALDAVESEK